MHTVPGSWICEHRQRHWLDQWKTWRKSDYRATRDRQRKKPSNQNKGTTEHAVPTCKHKIKKEKTKHYIWTGTAASADFMHLLYIRLQTHSRKMKYSKNTKYLTSRKKFYCYAVLFPILCSLSSPLHFTLKKKQRMYVQNMIFKLFWRMYREYSNTKTPLTI